MQAVSVLWFIDIAPGPLCDLQTSSKLTTGATFQPVLSTKYVTQYVTDNTNYLKHCIPCLYTQAFVLILTTYRLGAYWLRGAGARSTGHSLVRPYPLLTLPRQGRQCRCQLCTNHRIKGTDVFNSVTSIDMWGSTGTSTWTFVWNDEYVSGKSVPWSGVRLELIFNKVAEPRHRVLMLKNIIHDVSTSTESNIILQRRLPEICSASILCSKCILSYSTGTNSFNQLNVRNIDYVYDAWNYEAPIEARGRIGPRYHFLNVEIASDATGRKRN